MANALVISGHLRTFRDIADELVDFIDKNKLDVFMYVWDENNQDEIDYAVERLKPVKWLSEKNELYAQSFLDAEQRISTVNPKQLITPDRNHVTLSMHFARRKAFELIEKEYDNLIKNKSNQFTTIVQEFIEKFEKVINKLPKNILMKISKFLDLIRSRLVKNLFALKPALGM